LKKITIQELRDIQIQILNIVDKYCIEHNIKYFLCYGSLLGAVRHQGYIPWDDDIDIAMPRKDYNRFIKGFNTYSDLYQIYTEENSEGFCFPFSKVTFENSLMKEDFDNCQSIGINIDIFPIDSVSNNPYKVKATMRYIQYLRYIIDIKRIAIDPQRSYLKNMLLYTGKILLKFLNSNTIAKKITKIAKKYENNSNSTYAGILVWGYGKREIVDIKVFDEAIYAKFVNQNYPIPQRYHEWLSSTYGDYLKLPPEEDRVTHHKFEAYRVVK